MCLFGITHHFMSHSNSRFWLAVFFNHFAPLMFLIGPFLYFYVRGTLKDRYALTKKDAIHFIPALFALIGTLPYIFQSFENKLRIADRIIENVTSVNQIEVNIFYKIGGSLALRAFFGFVYLLYCIYLVWQHYPSKKETLQIPRKQFWITYRWLCILLGSLLTINVSLAITALQPASLIVRENFFADGDVFYQITGMAYFVLSISLMLFPEILYGMPKRMEQTTTKKKTTKTKAVSDEDPFIEVNESIVDYLTTQKPYLNPDFDISNIAFDLKIPQNHVSYCISNIMNTRFSKLKAELRIQHAIGLLKEGHNSSITIDGIGTQSGFKTRSYYYEVFKKETGYTPSEYIENLKTKNQ
jgi:AraC-like DNA-binding protein